MDETRPIQLDYYQELDDLVDSGNYDGRDDFALVMQPMWVNQEFPHDVSRKTVITYTCIIELYLTLLFYYIVKFYT